MPRFVATVAKGFAPNIVAEAIKQVDPAGIVVVAVHRNMNSYRTSGLILIECSEEIAAKIEERKIEGVKYFAKEIIYSPI